MGEVTATIAQHLRQLMPATVYALYRYDVDTDALICENVIGDPQGLMSGLTIRVGERVTGWSAANQRTSLNSDAYLDLGPIAEMCQPNLKSTISSPLIHRGPCHGGFVRLLIKA